ncbi:hypothetical protein [Clostridium ljungdahlii]|uniref:hypothetical protein n=1 Tax=Clostridium ljungdahlii TaxID=1538 RepID=UPI00386E4ACA
MSLLYTKEQKELIALVKEMAENEIKPHVQELDEKANVQENCLSMLLIWDFICLRFQKNMVEQD